MSRYPDLAAAKEFTVEILRPMIPDIYIKNSATGRTNTAALADDPDLAGIALGVGTWYVKGLFFTSANSATPDLKTRWAFTGTWNNPVRACLGPASTNTASPEAVTPSRMAGIPANIDTAYGLANSGTYMAIIEECYRVIVTAAGNLSLQWAQNAATAATTTNIHEGSAFEVRQLA